MTILNQKYVDKNGTLLLRFVKPDGGYHRTSIMPGQDPDTQMQAVNAHLERMGHTKVDHETLSHIRTVVAEEHTPLVIAVFRAAQAVKE